MNGLVYSLNTVRASRRRKNEKPVSKRKCHAEEAERAGRLGVSLVRTKRKTAKQTAGHPGAIPNKTGCTACRKSFSLEINSELPKAVPTTVAALIGRYLNDEVKWAGWLMQR